MEEEMRSHSVFNIDGYYAILDGDRVIACSESPCALGKKYVSATEEESRPNSLDFSKFLLEKTDNIYMRRVSASKNNRERQQIESTIEYFVNKE
jgi:hypothetical protein